MLKRLVPPLHYSQQERFRHYLYTFSLIIGIPNLLVIWYFIQADDPFARVSYILMLLHNIWALNALLKAKQSLQFIERTTLTVLIFIWLSRALYTSFLASTAVQNLANQDVYLGYILICVLAYVVFDNASALKIAASIFVFSLALASTQFLPASSPTGYVAILQFHAYLAFIIGAIHILSHIKTELSESQAKTDMLELIAFKDSLTGLNNRRRVYEALKNNLVIAERYARPFSLILLDIDHFKQINDAHGHDVGDLVLKEFANLISLHVRKTDIVGRWGGEEFLIVCHETPLEEVSHLAERMCKVIAKHTFPTVKQVTASFGAVSHSEGITAEDMLKSADLLLYEAKNSGRNQVKSQQLSPQALLRLSYQADLSRR